MTMAPRLYLNNMATVADTGLFSVGYNVASLIAFVAGALNQAYVPELFKRLSSPSTDLFHLARILLMGAVTLLVLSAAYGFAAYLFLTLIVGPHFYDAAGYVMWIGLAFATQGLCFIFGTFVIYSKKTYLLSWRSDFVGGIVVLVLCPIMISLNGPIGAAQAFFLAYFVSLLGYIVASRKAFPMPWGSAVKSLICFYNK